MKNKGEVKEMYLAKKSAKILKPLLEKYYRAKFIGIENIPDTPFLGIGNHLGVYFMPESFLWLTKYYSLKNKPPMKVLVHNALHNIAKFLVLPEKEFGILDANPKNAVESLKNGTLIPTTQTITLDWYKKILNDKELFEKFQINGKIL